MASRKYIVRYGDMRLQGRFGVVGDASYRPRQQVIARSDRGLEAAVVLCDAEGKEKGNLPKGQILRAMTDEDIAEMRRIQKHTCHEMDTCQRYVKELGLDMQLVDVERIFGGERVVFYYLAEGRIDFRELVRKLASEYQTRIEMRQIGVRDEAKLLADFGDCGKEVCCNSCLRQMPPVSMRMAKLQKATLDPTKISGRCGRLKCCLRYEFDTYEEKSKKIPSVGSRIKTADGIGRVVEVELMSEMLSVLYDDRRLVTIPASQVLEKLEKRDKRGEKPADKRSGKPTGKREGKPADKRSEKPTGKRERKQTPKRDEKPTGKRDENKQANVRNDKDSREKGDK